MRSVSVFIVIRGKADYKGGVGVACARLGKN